jgi:NAD(P)-dependent dehydrogenase (short-subunit alcohol dehydrogenase family)
VQVRNFDGKVAVITGAASGIGKAIAHECIRRKMKVVLADIHHQELNTLEAELKQLNRGEVTSLVVDVSASSDIKRLAKHALSAFGAVHLLFNNAGISGPLGAVWEVDAVALEKVINTNLMSVIYSLREFVPIMLKQKDHCHIINTASGSGLHTAPNMSGYIATKHAVVALSEVLYFDLEERQANIQVSVLCPGLVNTQLTSSIVVKANAPEKVKQLADFFEQQIKKSMLPHEVAKQVFSAIENNQFYILTHYNEHKLLIETRMKNLLKRHNPENPRLFKS